jgi:hypothetical protein
MRVAIEQVPIEVRRRAARMLAGITEHHVFPRSDREPARPMLGAEVCPVYRSDIDGVAYWEFELSGVRTILPLPGIPVVGDVSKGFDRGFLVVSTGRHDVPVPHFSLEIAPPSRQLEALGGPAARVVKLDTLCYVAEDAAGTMLAHIGTLPPKLIGMPKELPRRIPLGWARTGDPGGPTAGGRPEDRRADGERAPRRRLHRSRESRPLAGSGAWRSWAECKQGYAETYRVHLEALAAHAERPWDIDELTLAYGEGIRSGEPFPVLMLAEGTYELSGPGARLVDVAHDPKTLRLTLTATAGPGIRDTSFDLQLSYRDAAETLPFFVLPDHAPTTAPRMPEWGTVLSAAPVPAGALR